MITKRQKQVLEYIKFYKTKHGYAPLLEEIKKHLKLSSVSTAHHHVKALEELGDLRKEENHPRAIDVYEEAEMLQIPLLGLIAAGQPILALEDKEFIAVPKSRIPKSGDFYALRVVGESMVDENIDHGDIVIVRSQSTADNGQKIVALINNDEVTLKRFYLDGNKVRLQPANPAYKPLIIDPENLIVQGVIVDIIKRGSELKEDPPLFKKNIERDKNLPLDKIICGDALSLLQKLPDKSIDLIIADPPYNLSKGNHIRFNNSGGLRGFGGEWNKVMESWDNVSLLNYFEFTLNWLREARRVLKTTGSIWVFGTYHNIGLINLIFQILSIEIINEIIWYKRNAFPNLAGRRFTASHETLLWGNVNTGKRQYYFDYKKSKEYHDATDLLKARGKQMRTVWDIPNNKEAREIKYGKHPTQKPLSICKRIVSLCSRPNDLVLAPFAGSGSECVAAKELSRHFIGFELDTRYVEVAKKRLKNSNDQQLLFK